MHIHVFYVHISLNAQISISASQSGKYSVTVQLRSREMRFPERCQTFLVECGSKIWWSTGKMCGHR
jgi:hypothetical protein